MACIAVFILLLEWIIFLLLANVSKDIKHTAERDDLCMEAFIDMMVFNRRKPEKIQTNQSTKQTKAHPQ